MILEKHASFDDFEKMLGLLMILGQNAGSSDDFEEDAAPK